MSSLDGQQIPVEVALSPIEYDGRRAIQAVIRNISERKEAEDKLRQSERRLFEIQKLIETVISGTDVMITTVDSDFHYTYFSQSYAAEMKRLTGKEIALGTNMLDHFEAMPEQREIARREWQQVLDGEATNKTLGFGDACHYHRVYNVLHTPIRDESGNVVGAGEVAYDITDHKLQEERVAKLSRFYSVLSHVNEAIIRIHEENVLCSEICRIVADEGNFPLVWIGEVKDSEVIPIASHGSAKDYLNEIKIELRGTE